MASDASESTSPTGPAGVAAVLFLAVGGFAVLGPGNRGQPAGVAATADAADGKVSSLTLRFGGEKPGDDFPYHQPFRQFRTPTGGPDPSPPHAADAAVFLELAAKNDLRAIVTTLPDPVLSRLGYRFDLALEAIERAVETQGFVLDRWWLPWDLGGARGGDKGDSSPARIRAGCDPEKQPGVILFRQYNRLAKDRERPGLLALIIVGEMPTAGVHQVAFRNALDLAARCTDVPWRPAASAASVAGGLAARMAGFCPHFLPAVVDDLIPGVVASRPPNESRLVADWASAVAGTAATMAGPHPHRLPSAVTVGQALASENRSVRVLGPSFRGSVDSVRRGLEGWLKSGLAADAEVVSGGVTGESEAEFPPNVRFRRTLQTDLVTTKILWKYLQDLGATADNTVWLRETSTASGIGSANRQRNENKENKMGLLLPFPLHISQVRGVYNRERLAADDSLPRLPRSTTRLRIPFDDSAAVRDVVPPLTGEMTAAAAEMILAQTMDSVARGHVRFVGVMATDVRDKLFLASQVREVAPNVQLFTNTCESLLTHPNYLPFLRGMVVASGYPLHPPTQDWCWPYGGGDERYEFSHQSHQGLFNATLALLTDDPGATLGGTGGPMKPEDGKAANDPRWRMLDYGTPFAELAGDGVPDEQGYPPVWLGVIGNRGVYPVETDTPDQLLSTMTPADKDIGGVTKAKDAVYRVRDAVAGDSGGVAGRVVPTFSGSGVVFVVAAYGLAILSLLSPKDLWRPAAHDINRRGQWFVSLVWCGTVAGTALTMLPVLFIPTGVPTGAGTLTWDHRSIPPLACSAVVAAAAAVASGRLRAAGAKSATLAHVLWAVVALAAVAVFLRFAHLGWIDGGSRWDQRILRFHRTTDLAGGVSFVTPILLLAAAVGLWCRTGLKLIQMNERDRIKSAFFGDSPDDISRDVIKEQDELKNAVKNPFWMKKLRHWLPLCLIFGELTVRVPFRGVWTVEGRATDGLTFGLAVVVTGMLVHSAARFLTIWSELQDLLRVLTLVPMMTAYDRLPGHVVRQFGRFLSSHRSHGDRLHVERHLIRVLAANCSDVPNVPVEPPPRENGRAAWWRRLVAHVRGRERDEVRRDKLDAWVTAVAEKCVQKLAKHWNRWASGYAYGPGTTAEKSDKKAEGPDAKLGPKEPSYPLKLAEDVVAARTVAYVGQYFVYLRQLANFLVCGSLLLLLAAGSYPFQPARVIQVWTWGAVVGVGVLIVTFLVQMDKDEFVSRVTKTDPGRITFDRAFVQNMVTYVAPLVTVLAFQFPTVGEFLRTLFEPFLRGPR
jgi:hypothetical protein